MNIPKNKLEQVKKAIQEICDKWESHPDKTGSIEQHAIELEKIIDVYNHII